MVSNAELAVASLQLGLQSCSVVSVMRKRRKKEKEKEKKKSVQTVKSLLDPVLAPFCFLGVITGQILDLVQDAEILDGLDTRADQVGNLSCLGFQVIWTSRTSVMNEFVESLNKGRERGGGGGSNT